MCYKKAFLFFPINVRKNLIKHCNQLKIYDYINIFKANDLVFVDQEVIKVF